MDEAVRILIVEDLPTDAELCEREVRAGEPPRYPRAMEEDE